MPLPLAVIFWGALSSVIVPLATRVLVGLGFGAITYGGIGLLWDSMQDNLVASLGSLSGSIVTILAMAQVDDAIKVILSAITAKLVVNGLTAAGAISRVRFTGGAGSG